MIVCVVKYILGADKQWEAERIADVVYTKLSGYPGFIEHKFAEDVDAGEYVSLAFWETREQALQAHPSIHPFVNELIDHQFPLSIELFDVYSPKNLSE